VVVNYESSAQEIIQRGILKKEAENQREQQHNENKSAICWSTYSKILQ
jgi:hypothetical protein